MIIYYLSWRQQRVPSPLAQINTSVAAALPYYWFVRRTRRLMRRWAVSGYVGERLHLFTTMSSFPISFEMPQTGSGPIKRFLLSAFASWSVFIAWYIGIAWYLYQFYNVLYIKSIQIGDALQNWTGVYITGYQCYKSRLTIWHYVSLLKWQWQASKAYISAWSIVACVLRELKIPWYTLRLSSLI